MGGIIVLTKQQVAQRLKGIISKKTRVLSGKGNDADVDFDQLYLGDFQKRKVSSKSVSPEYHSDC
jgi:hypothetical protein